MLNKKEGNGGVPLFKRLLGQNRRTLIIAAALILGLLLIGLSALPAESAESEDDEIEEKLREMCSSLEGVGSCRVMVTYRVTEKKYGQSTERRVESVAVICKGADKVGVRAELTEMLSSLFGIGTNRIHISKMR